MDPSEEFKILCAENKVFPPDYIVRQLDNITRWYNSSPASLCSTQNIRKFLTYCPIWLNDKIQTLRLENNKEVLLSWKVLAYKNHLLTTKQYIPFKTIFCKLKRYPYFYPLLFDSFSSFIPLSTVITIWGRIIDGADTVFASYNWCHLKCFKRTETVKTFPMSRNNWGLGY